MIKELIAQEIRNMLLVGRALSFAVKYGLSKLLCIESGDDEESRIQEQVTEKINSEYGDYVLKSTAMKDKKLSEIPIITLKTGFKKARNEFCESDIIAIDKYLGGKND